MDLYGWQSTIHPQPWSCLWMLSARFNTWVIRDWWLVTRLMVFSLMSLTVQATLLPTVNRVASGKRLHNYGKSPCLMGKSTISMVIFNSYVAHYQRVLQSYMIHGGAPLWHGSHWLPGSSRGTPRWASLLGRLPLAFRNPVVSLLEPKDSP